MAKNKEPEFGEPTDEEQAEQDRLERRDGRDRPRSLADDPDWLRAAGERAAKQQLFGPFGG